jgi:hypothetical protein
MLQLQLQLGLVRPASAAVQLLPWQLPLPLPAPHSAAWPGVHSPVVCPVLLLPWNFSSSPEPLPLLPVLRRQEAWPLLLQLQLEVPWMLLPLLLPPLLLPLLRCLALRVRHSALLQLLLHRA